MLEFHRPEDALDARAAPPPSCGTVERWAWDFILTTDLDRKMVPPAPPRAWERGAPARRIERPGRPAGLGVVAHAPKPVGAEALRNPKRRAQLVHGFLHHELQAAELLAWAILAFPDTPVRFRRGLVAIALDEIRHIGSYASYLRNLGHRYGDFPVRDWFWDRVPSATTAAQFVAVLGVGFEGGNLDHTARFAERFRRVGDVEGAELQERIGLEEIPHVRFAWRWFRTWVPDASFASWSSHLPPPLSPMLMRGRPVQRELRARAGLPPAFIDELAEFLPCP